MLRKQKQTDRIKIITALKPSGEILTAQKSMAVIHSTSKTQSLLTPLFSDNTHLYFIFHLQTLMKKLRVSFNEFLEDHADYKITNQALSNYIKNYIEQRNYLTELFFTIKWYRALLADVQEINFQQLIKDIILLLFPFQYDQNVKFKIQNFIPNPCEIFIDKARIYLILLTILFNAALMTFDGEIIVDGKIKEKNQLQLMITCLIDPKKEFLMHEEVLLQKEFLDPINYRNTSGLQSTRELLNDLKGHFQIQQKMPNQIQFILELPLQQQGGTLC